MPERSIEPCGMNEVHLETPDEVIRRLNELPDGYVFRGQASADWRLESSLERILGDRWSRETARKFEDHALNRFRPKFHLYDGENVEPSSRLAWLSIMQHYGAPTRLLDFTESPFVALYFALESVDSRMLQARVESRMAIFALRYSRMMDASLQYINERGPSFPDAGCSIHAEQDRVFDEVIDRLSLPIAWVTEPDRINKRLDRQSGCFLVAGDLSSRIQDILNSPIYAGIDFTKFTIPVELFSHLYALLRKMNLNSKCIYGDLQGLCRAIRMELQVYAS